MPIQVYISIYIYIVFVAILTCEAYSNSQVLCLQLTVNGVCGQPVIVQRHVGVDTEGTPEQRPG